MRTMDQIFKHFLVPQIISDTVWFGMNAYWINGLNTTESEALHFPCIPND